jgi:hypothetical protein
MMNHKYIFIGGLHRSGTSILFRSLRDHPAISGFTNTPSPEDEGMHLQSVFQPSGAFGGAGEFGFYPDAHLTERSPIISEKNVNKLFQEWSSYWDLGKPYLLEKSPPNLIRTRFLQAIFPNSYFLILMRHPIAVSYATRAWYRKYRIHWRSLSRILEHWIVCHEIFQADFKYLDRVFLIKYEAFVADPEKWLNQIYGFLDINHHPVEQNVLQHVNEKYFTRWRVDQGKFFRKRAIDRMIQKYETRLKPFGYSLIDLDFADLGNLFV